MQRVFSLLVMGGILFFSVVIENTAQDVDVAFDLERVQQATVFLMQVLESNEDRVITCVSSGTLVSRDGLILSNAHGTVMSEACPGDILFVALNVRPGEPPRPTYRASVVQADDGLDLAILRIDAGLDGRTLTPSDLALPFVEIGDSTGVTLDDTVTVVGYPGISDDPATAVSAVIQGFTAEPRGGGRSWLKIRTDAASGDEIFGTMSGGGAYNRQGQLVGVPTTAPLGNQVAGTSCQLIQDTNGDNLINPNDRCVPVGGSINALRPSNFAQPLFRSASLQLQIEKLSEPPSQINSGGPPSINRLIFASSVTNGQPTSVISRLPAGSDSLYLFFDYQNMTPETVYELRVTTNGNINPVFSLAPVRWSGGTSGMWHIGGVGQTWPNGQYEFTLFIDGIAAAPPQFIEIGGAADTEPTFRSIEFALIEDNQMFGSGYVLGAGTTVNAQVIYDNIEAGTPWQAIWYFNGSEIAREETAWPTGLPLNGSEDIGGISLSEGGLVPGQYRLELYINGILSATSDFTVAGARSGAIPDVFTVVDEEGERESTLRFVVADSPQEATERPGVSSFTNAVDTLYALFDWQFLAPGTLWQMRWAVDNEVFYDQIVPWRVGESGRDFVTQLTGPDGVPDGTYTMELFINNIRLGGTEIEIGIGQLPLDPFAEAEGLQLRGQFLDAETREGVSDVTFILISEDFSVIDYEARSDQLYAMATSDRNGNFVIDRPLEFGAPYSVFIAAEGYLPITADGFEVSTDTANPLELSIYLTRD